MGIVSFLKSIGNRNSPSRPPIDIRYINGQVVYYNLDWETYIQKGYKGNIDVFSIVNDLSRRRSQAPIELYKIESQKSHQRAKCIIKSNYGKAHLKTGLGQEVATSPVLDLFRSPNHYQSFAQFIYSASLFSEIMGEIFIWKVRGQTALTQNQVIEMHLFPPHDIDIVSDGTFRGVKHYRVKSIQKEIPVSDMIHWAKPTLNQLDRYAPERGVSPLEVGSKVLQKANSSEDAAVDLFETRGGRGAVFIDDPNIDSADTNFSVQENRFNRRMYGDNSKGRWFWANAKLGMLDLSKNADQLDLLNQQRYSTSQLCRLFGYDETLFSSEIKTYNNYQTAVKRVIVTGVLPWLSDFASTLTTQLLPDFGITDAALVFDESYFPELQNDIIETGKQLEEISFLSDNEKRSYFNYAPYNHPNADKLYKKTGVEPIEDLGLLDFNENNESEAAQ